jgi:hypothetical protein
MEIKGKDLTSFTRQFADTILLSRVRNYLNIEQSGSGGTRGQEKPTTLGQAVVNKGRSIY